jgi:hypothetical protein
MDLFLTIAGVALVAALPVSMILLSRALAPEGWDLADLFKASSEPGWPRGVQEEEPVAWRVDLLGAVGTAAESVPDVDTPHRRQIRGGGRSVGHLGQAGNRTQKRVPPPLRGSNPTVP